MPRKLTFTPRRRAAFLKALAESGHVLASARRAHVSPAHVYRCRNRFPAFRQAWDDALAVAVESLETEARRRALDGWEDPVYYQGQPVGAIRRYSDRLLIVLLQAHKPELYNQQQIAERQSCENLMEQLERARRRVEAGRRADAAGE